MQKTNAIRILEKLKIEFSTDEYPVDLDELDALSVALKINAEPERVFKTLVARSSDDNIYVFCIPGNFELNLKLAAHAANVKKIELINLRELLPLTGYIRGGCSPIGMKKKYKTFIDETAQLFDKIFVSAGARGIQVSISPKDLIRAVEGIFAELI